MCRQDHQDRKDGGDRGVAEVSGKEMQDWGRSQVVNNGRKLALVPGSPHLPLDPGSRPRLAGSLGQGQASVTGTGHVMPHYLDEAVMVPAVKGPAWPQPDIYSHGKTSYHMQDNYNHVTRKKKTARRNQTKGQLRLPESIKIAICKVLRQLYSVCCRPKC